MTFSVAQAFTPGKQRGYYYKKPHNGALVARPVSHMKCRSLPNVGLPHRAKFP